MTAFFSGVYERHRGVGKKQNKTGRRPDPIILMKYRFTETKKKTETETIVSDGVFARISKNVRKNRVLTKKKNHCRLTIKIQNVILLVNHNNT